MAAKGREEDLEDGSGKAIGSRASAGRVLRRREWICFEVQTDGELG
jgi:hypothetical protein